MAGTLKLDKIISHTMPLDKINEAFDIMHAGKRFVQLTQSLSIVYDTGRKNYILMLNLCHVPIDCLFFFFSAASAQ